MHKVLIADDDLAILHALSLGLQDEGFDVRTVVDESAMDQIREFRPDAVLLDIWFGNIHGGELCAQIKSDVQLRDTIVILISTGHNTAEIAAASGADGYLLKPLDIDDLSATLGELLAR